MIKTVKEDWTCPDVQVQLFVPQDCVAACSRIMGDFYLNYKYKRLQTFERGEHLRDGRLLDAGNDDVDTYYDVSAYKDIEWIIIATIYRDRDYMTTYPVVDVRQEYGGYYAYNATS